MNALRSARKRCSSDGTPPMSAPDAASLSANSQHAEKFRRQEQGGWLLVDFRENDEETKMKSTNPSAVKVIKGIRRIARKQYAQKAYRGHQGRNALASLCWQN